MFENKYFPFNNSNMARDKLRIVRQKGRGADYDAEYDTLVVSLLESNVGDFIHAFIYGLKANLCPFVKA